MLLSYQNFLMASKAIEDKKQEMEATMVNLGDKVGSNIQQGLTNLPVAGVMNRRTEGSDSQAEFTIVTIIIVTGRFLKQKILLFAKLFEPQ